MHLQRKKSKKIKLSAIFGLSSYDKTILKQLWEGLKKADIQAKPPTIKCLKGTPFGHDGYVYNNDMWRLIVNRKESLWILIHYWERYSRHKDKLMAIERAKNNIILRNQLPHCHKIDLSDPKIGWQ